MDPIDRIRQFNHQMASRFSLLDRSHKDGALSLSQMRVLEELARAPLQPAVKLVATLGLDEGYLSRILAGFSKSGWIERSADQRDSRRRVISLTQAGETIVKNIATRSRDLIAQELSHLSDQDKLFLSQLLSEASLIMQPKELNDIRFRDLEIGDAGWIIERHAKLYAQEESYDASFEGFCAQIITTFLEERDLATERGFVAHQDGVRLGAVLATRETQETARLRAFFIEPFARGRGLGQIMLEQVIDFARETGAQRLHLWTHKSHEAACALYKNRGFQLMNEKKNRSFGQDVIEQIYELPL